MVKVAINGAAGRMGKLLVRLVCEEERFELVSALERPQHPDSGKDAGIVAGAGQTGVKISSELDGEVDVLIDFSEPSSTLQRLRQCVENNIAMVIGTTGHNQEGLEEIRNSASQIPIVLSPNMSLGVNLLVEILPKVARALGGGFDIEIVEAHHRFKKDAPSGTALKLAEAIAEALGISLEENVVYGRHGIPGERTSSEIGVFAVRAGDIVGEHTVVFGGLGERIEIKHIAHSRECFARGALRSAEFIVSQPSGLYSMRDVLSLQQ